MGKNDGKFSLRFYTCLFMADLFEGMTNRTDSLLVCEKRAWKRKHRVVEEGTGHSACAYVRPKACSVIMSTEDQMRL